MTACPLCRHPDTPLLLQDIVSGRERRDHACSRCGLLFLDPALHLSPEEEKERYDLHRNDPRDPGYLEFLGRLGRPLMNRIRSGSRGLDFGCGPGPAMAEVLKGSGAALSLYDPFYRPDPGLRKQKWDFITLSEVAEHLREPGREFERLAGMLEPGGILAVMTVMPEEGMDLAGWWYRKDPTHICFYRRHTFLWIAERFGLAPEFPAPNVAFLIRSKR